VKNLKAIIRVMPNTPALVGAGCAGLMIINYNNFLKSKWLILLNVFCFIASSVYCLNEHATCKHADVTMKIFESVGICHQVPESQLDAFTGFTGSGPGYVSSIG